MPGYRKNALLNIFFNYSNIIFNIVYGILLIPLYLKKIPLDVYGSFIVASGISVLIGLLEFGLSMVTTQRLSTSYAASDKTIFKSIISNGAVTATLLFCISALLSLVIGSKIAEITKVNLDYTRDIYVAFLFLSIAGAINIYLNLFGSIFQALLRAGILGVINLASTIIGILTILLSFSCWPSLTSIAAGSIIRTMSATLLLMIFAYLTLREKRLLPKMSDIKIKIVINLLESSAPIFIGGLSKSIVENMQNIMLVNILSPTTVAIISLTQKIFQLCGMVLAPIGSSIYSVFVQIKSKTTQENFSKLIEIAIKSQFLLTIALIGIANTFNDDFVILWVGNDKYGGFLLSTLLGLSMLFSSRYYFFSFLIYSNGEFKKTAKIELSYAILKILILYILIGEIGLYAVPVAEIIPGLLFQFLLSARIVSTYIINKNQNWIYLKGWFEYIIITVVGYYYLIGYGKLENWTSLIYSIVIFSLITLIIIILLNINLYKEIIYYLKNR